MPKTVNAPLNLELTTTQKRALDVLRRFERRSGAVPSVRQFAAALGVSHGAAHKMLKQLETKGALRRAVTAVRLKLTPKGRQS